MENITSKLNQDDFDTLKNHHSLEILLPYVKSHHIKGFKALDSGEKKFSASVIEIYATEILERTSEFDNSLHGLQLAIQYVVQLSMESDPEPETYRYHYENFVLRVIGCADRAYRLTGSALLIEKSKLESISGNRVVEQHVKNHSEIFNALTGVLAAVRDYRGPRNELIHNSAYSSRALFLFKNIKRLRIDTGSIDVNSLARTHFSTEAQQMTKTLEEIVGAATSLLNALQPIFLDVVQFNLKEK